VWNYDSILMSCHVMLMCFSKIFFWIPNHLMQTSFFSLFFACLFLSDIWVFTYLFFNSKNHHFSLYLIKTMKVYCIKCLKSLFFLNHIIKIWNGWNNSIVCPKWWNYHSFFHVNHIFRIRHLFLFYPMDSLPDKWGSLIQKTLDFCIFCNY